MRGEPPVEFYACIDISDPLVAWETAVGRISSGIGRTADGFGVSLWMHGLLREGTSRRVLREFALERVRQDLAATAVSRLDGLYLFRSEAEASLALDRWGWTPKKSQLSRVLFWPTATTVVDSEWITNDLLGADDDWMPLYWAGDTRGDLPVPEVLARGVGLIDNFDLRRKAYERISEKFPRASKLLAFSAAAFWCGYDTAGQVKPGVLLTDGGISSSYYIYMRDFENGSGLDMAAVLRQCATDGAAFPYHPVCDETGEIHLPDFRDTNVRLADEELHELVAAVHDNTATGPPPPSRGTFQRPGS